MTRVFERSRPSKHEVDGESSRHGDGAAQDDGMQLQVRAGETLLRIGSILSSELDHDALVQKLTDEATALCGAEFGAFFYNVVDGRGESYMLYTLSGVDRSAFAGFPMPRNTAVFKPTFDGTEVVRMADVREDPRYGKSAPHHGMPEGHLPVRSYLAVPVKTRSGEVLGGLFFGHQRTNVFTAADERLLVALSAQAGIALENARLFRALGGAEADAQEQRELMRQLFLQSPALIVILRGPDHVYDFVNLRAQELLGHADVIGKRVDEVLVGMPPERRALLDHVFHTGERHVSEAVSSVRDWRGDGRPYERFFDVTYEPYRDREGRVAGVMSFGFEVTQQVLAQRKTEAALVELENANRAKDEFLATVSHELRTPLNSIVGWVSLLRNGELNADKQRHALEVIERNAKLQAKLIEDLLDVTRIISGKLSLDIASMDLNAAVEAAIEAVRPAASAKGISLKFEPNLAVGPIRGDAARLQQVTWNLLSNAVKFTPALGVVRVALALRDGRVALRVTDNGAGIAPEFLPHVFERFRQADASSTRRYGGLGIGLAIVRSLVELHGGTVRAASQGPGSGATFIVELPIGRDEERDSSLRSRRQVAPPPTAQLESVRVLLVDDEPDTREVLAEYLTEQHAEVTVAGSTAEALASLRRALPHVIVSDIGMPGEDGYALIAKLRALPPADGGRIPAIALTAYASAADRLRALSAGFNDHLAKPADLTALTSTIRKLSVLSPRT